MTSWWPGGDVGLVEAYLRDISGAATDGRLHPMPDSAASAHAFAALLAEHREYRKVKAPTLAIYAETFLSQPGKDSAATAAIQRWETKHLVPFRAASRARIRKELRGAEIVSVPGSHGNFILVSRDSVAAAMTTFLLGG